MWNNFLKKMDFKIFCLDFPEKKNFERKFFKKNYTTPKDKFSNDFKHHK